jgi:hypothetical protein
MNSQPQKVGKSSNFFRFIQFCRAFYADHFDKKKFLVSSTNDNATVKILKSIMLPNGSRAILDLLVF